jgi:hypothetical protein
MIGVQPGFRTPPPTLSPLAACPKPCTALRMHPPLLPALPPAWQSWLVLLAVPAWHFPASSLAAGPCDELRQIEGREPQ